MNDASQNIIVNILKTDWNFELKFGGNFLYMICFKLSRVIEQYFNIYFLMKTLMCHPIGYQVQKWDHITLDG